MARFRGRGFSWPWGDALADAARPRPDARVINLETSITTSRELRAGQGHSLPDESGQPSAAWPRPSRMRARWRTTTCSTSGAAGCEDTLDALSGPGSGRWGPGATPPRPGVRLPSRCQVAGRVVHLLAAARSPAGSRRAGLPHRTGPESTCLPDLSDATADDVIGRTAAAKRPGDVVVVSIHWGSNWGYDVDPDQVRFAHRLIDGGVDLIHGHSSHHPRPGRGVPRQAGPVRLRRLHQRLRRHRRPRARTGAICGCSTSRRVQPDTGTLVTLRMAPMRARKLRLRRAPAADAGGCGRYWNRPAAVSARVVDPSRTVCWSLRPGGP